MALPHDPNDDASTMGLSNISLQEKKGKHRELNPKKTKKILSFEVQTRVSKHKIRVQSLKREIRI